MDWLGAEVTDAAGAPYARLEEVFVGRTSGTPEFGVVALTASGSQGDRVVVPLDGAESGPGGTVRLGVDREQVLHAPRLQRDVEEIPSAAGRLVRAHFGLEEPTAQTTVAPAADDEPTEVVRHEEQLTVGTRAEATERVRVRRRVVTEEVTLTVSLRREELVIERVPIDEGTPRPADGEFAFAEEGADVEFVLHAEEPVVSKRIVPVERVRLHRETTTEDRHITDTVRKERVEVDELPPTREDHHP